MFKGRFNKFNRGEIDEAAMTRDDVERVDNGSDLMENMFAQRLGPMQYRPGTEYLGTVKANESHFLVPFISKGSETTLLEFSQSDATPSVETLRIWIDDVLMARAATSDTVANGGFTSDISGWTDDSDASGSTAWDSSGAMEITGDGSGDWGRSYQDVSTTAGARGLRVNVSRAPVYLQLGTGGNGSSDVFSGWLNRGVHSFEINPGAGTLTITLSNDKAYATLVGLCDFESSGNFELSTSMFPTDSGNGDTLPTLRYTQTADVMYLTSNGYELVGRARPTIIIQRWATRSWSFVIPEIIDGPFGTINTTQQTLTLAAVTGDTTLTSSIPFFRDPDHVGRQYQLVHSGTIGRCEVTAITSVTVAQVRVLQEAGATTATADWYEGLFALYLPSPTATEIFEGRLWLAGGGRLYGSVSDAYSSFDQETGGDAAPIIKTIGFGPVQSISWLAGGEQIVIGMTSEEVVLNSNEFGDAMTNANARIRRGTSEGSALVAPLVVNKVVYFVQRALKKLVALTGLSGEDVTAHDTTILHPDICEAGIKRIAYAGEPEPRVFVLLENGAVRVYLFDRAENVAGWQRMTLGGGGTVEDIVAAPTGTEDAVYLLVERAGTRYLERLAKVSQAQGGSDSRHYDSHVVYASPGTTLSGLGHLEGLEVYVWADGKERESATVSSGEVEVSDSWTDVVVGLKHTGKWRSNRILNYIDEMVLTDRKRIVKLGVIMRNVALPTVSYGPDESSLSGTPKVDLEKLQAPSDDPIIGGSGGAAADFPEQGDMVRGPDYFYIISGRVPPPSAYKAAVLATTHDDGSALAVHFLWEMLLDSGTARRVIGEESAVPTIGGPTELNVTGAHTEETDSALGGYVRFSGGTGGNDSEVMINWNTSAGCTFEIVARLPTGFTTDSTRRSIFEVGNGGNNRLSWCPRSGNHEFVMRSTTDILTAGAYDLDEWMMITIEVNNNTGIAYLNGSSLGAEGSIGGGGDLTYLYLMQSNYDSSPNPPVDIKWVSMYRGVIGAAQVSAHWDALASDLGL